MLGILFNVFLYVVQVCLSFVKVLILKVVELFSLGGGVKLYLCTHTAWFSLKFPLACGSDPKPLSEQQGESSNLDEHVQRLSSRMHRGTVSSEESAPGSVTAEPPAPLPRCDVQQEQSPGGLSGTTHKIGGLTA